MTSGAGSSHSQDAGLEAEVARVKHETRSEIERAKLQRDAKLKELRSTLQAVSTLVAEPSIIDVDKITKEKQKPRPLPISIEDQCKLLEEKGVKQWPQLLRQAAILYNGHLHQQYQAGSLVVEGFGRSIKVLDIIFPSLRGFFALVPNQNGIRSYINDDSILCALSRLQEDASPSTYIFQDPSEIDFYAGRDDDGNAIRGLQQNLKAVKGMTVPSKAVRFGQDMRADCREMLFLYNYHTGHHPNRELKGMAHWIACKFGAGVNWAYIHIADSTPGD